MTQRHREQIILLAKSHPVPSENKLERRLKRLERMARFYTEKAPTSPPAQAMMFKGFTSAVVYAIALAKMYRQLCIKLNDLAQELENETRTDSEG